MHSVKMVFSGVIKGEIVYQSSLIKRNNFYFGMSETKLEEIPEGALASSEAKPVDLEELKNQIRKSRQALIDSLNGIPDNFAQKKILQPSVFKTPEKNEAIQLPVTVKKQDQRVLFQTATKTEPRKQMYKTSVRVSNSKEIQQVLYQDMPERRSMSPVEQPAQSLIVAQARRNKDISQSTILPRMNRNSLTPTKITFCYQNKPSDSVAYVSYKQESLSQTREKNDHLKESFVKELASRKPSPVQEKKVSPVVIRNPVVIKTSNPVFMRTSSPPLEPVVRKTINIQPLENRYVSVNAGSLQRHRIETTLGCKLQATGQYCKLCQMTRANLKGIRETRLSNIIRTQPRIERVDSDLILPEGESPVEPINSSPGKESAKRYLSAQNKDQCRSSYQQTGVRKSRRQIFGHSFLKEVENRNKVIQSELAKLNQSIHQTPSKIETPVQVFRESSYTRKRIFPEKTQKSNTQVKIEENQKKSGNITALPVRSISYVQGTPKEKVYSQINQTRSHLRSSSPLVINERKVIAPSTVNKTVVIAPPPVHNEKIVFSSAPRAQRVVTVTHPQAVPQFVRTITPIKTQSISSPVSPIIVERIVTPTNKDKLPTTVRQVESTRLQYGLMSEKNQFFKKDMVVSDTNRVKIPDFQRMQMSEGVRSWFSDHRREIDYQAERICSYDLIKRYMSEPEILVRLHKLILSQVDPKRWLLTLVDQVYGKLKDRYLPIQQ